MHFSLSGVKRIQSRDDKFLSGLPRRSITAYDCNLFALIKNCNRVDGCAILYRISLGGSRVFTEKYPGKMCRQYIHRILTFSRDASLYIDLYRTLREEREREKKRGRTWERERERLSIERIRAKYDWRTAAAFSATLLYKSYIYLTCLCK